MSFSSRPRLTLIHLYNNGVTLVATPWMPETFNPDLFVAKWYCREVWTEDMPGFAAEALEAGYDGLALRRLAGLIKPNSMDVGDLFQRALLEIGTVKILSQQEAVFFLSRMVATDIVEGRIDPQRGAGILAGYAAMLYYPPILNRFSQLGEMAFWGEYVSSDPKLVHEIMVEAHQLLASLPI
jgi:hypothetical protein